ncbi:hypothetical protein P170DRAFT_450157 [Aspergillus steynii IBT 23096]|uniref:C2H2-type domain-containing protein n=1 Tax=Aspergillus steynii IBT 23096 TaxID=1392250 RepID=A0A2I2FWY5_9EURO|nr:uncharacterized protein P170DRAFT_450157 [Aspergillus steynii IBT 23096]PLB45151.1 hypothetical protein P170DRAFT_450157 [Aspergillus steynii IBT 23096]
MEFYADDDVPRSPGLETSKIDYKPKESPPPFAVVDKGSDSDPAKKSADEGTSQDCSRKRQIPSKPSTTEGNSVLINHLDPSRPDIADFERNHPLSEDLLRDDLDPPKKHRLRRPDPPLAADESPKQPSDLGEKAKTALSLLFDESPKPEPKALGRSLIFGEATDSRPKNDLIPKLLSSEDHDPLKRAPEANSNISQFFKPASEVQAQNLLPALAPDSPENSHTLPSLQTALGLPSVSKDPGRPTGSSPYSLPPVTATSPPGLRSEPIWEQQRPGPLAAQVPPSPYSHWSPASTTARDISAVSSPASQNSHWRSVKSDISYLTSPYDVPPSAAKSPATSYPTPTDQTPASTCDRTPYSAHTQSNGALVPTGAFKCGWPGCTAPPFQTQYLLNSHANVHSQERPHFCAIEGCARGPGGKGFKRKNEMIRHGLVHNSPGYVCPFCPDQQHKYPRPDNLQRHVRVHHVDKSKDDPALRQVLSQRPEGSVRGRRRRQSVQ